jgi:hypothetical protein
MREAERIAGAKLGLRERLTTTKTTWGTLATLLRKLCTTFKEG